jgi:hypothetical protein
MSFLGDGKKQGAVLNRFAGRRLNVQLMGINPRWLQCARQPEIRCPNPAGEASDFLEVKTDRVFESSLDCRICRFPGSFHELSPNPQSRRQWRFLHCHHGEEFSGCVPLPGEKPGGLVSVCPLNWVNAEGLGLGLEAIINYIKK